MKHVFIIGSKGIPAKYGGFETFVEKLTEGKKSREIKYHVSCLANNTKTFEHHGARCFNVKVPDIGPAKAVYYDIAALKECIKYIRKNSIKMPIVYILACRIGPFVGHYKKQLNKLGGTLIVNPDGHEWKRAKWNKFIRRYWKVSEGYMVKHADLLVCDSKNIEKYIKEDYKKYSPKTTFIAYGADIKKSKLSDDDIILRQWYKDKNIKKKEYYLVVGRFVPENNYETMIAEFMKSKTNKDFVLITNVEKNKFYDELKNKTEFYKDKRIKFAGTVYNQEILKKIREDAYGYLHGHEVGGTNPSLLEALAITDLNLLLDVGFNREVGEDGAVYFNKENDNLANLINRLENVDEMFIKSLGSKAKDRIKKGYTWSYIIDKYENMFDENETVYGEMDSNQPAAIQI
ncbi:MAG: glycosyltransferase family 1 protein [Clostridium beijerinckii]|nr:glycosyltransferase family 1 protein [Clostridium beijerinckii]